MLWRSRHGSWYVDHHAPGRLSNLAQMSTAPPLCLDPDPHLTRAVNNILRVSVPTAPPSLKRKASAMDPEETALEKVRRAKIMQFMKPTTARPHKSVCPLTSTCLCLTVFQLESIGGYSTTKDGHNRHRPSPTNCTTTSNDQPTSNTFIRSAPINFQHSRSSTPSYYRRTAKTSLCFTCPSCDTHTCSCTSTATSSRCHEYIPAIFPDTTTHSYAIPAQACDFTAPLDRSAQTERISSDTTTIIPTPATATDTTGHCATTTCHRPTPTTSTTNPTHGCSYTGPTARCPSPVSCVVSACNSFGQLPRPICGLPEEGK